MTNSDIKLNETYLFVATDSPARKHLENTAFVVVEIKDVWRRIKKGRRKVKRFFNDNGEGARAEELEPMPVNFVADGLPDVKFGDDGSVEMTISGGIYLPPAPENSEDSCRECKSGQMELVGTHPNQFGATQVYECTNCGHTERFP